MRFAEIHSPVDTDMHFPTDRVESPSRNRVLASRWHLQAETEALVGPPLLVGNNPYPG